MTSTYLFDSHALLAFFQAERGSDVVARILQEALDKRLKRLICAINLGEIIYIIKRRFGDGKKLEVLGRIQQLGVRILPVPESLIFQAAELKAQYPISYADCFAVACAREQGAILITGDPDFKKVSHLVTIEWIHE
jgi:predicted nucleic acid-binding protein